jgi:hypothetical protein
MVVEVVDTVQAEDCVLRVVLQWVLGVVGTMQARDRVCDGNDEN